MVVCKCRKATKLYCFVHKVPVCGECICFTEHRNCVVRTYSEWVIDGEYDWPNKCSNCQAVLEESGGDVQTTRLGCLHIIHTNCLVTHIKSYPPHTAPAGYVCPTCSTSIWPPKSVKDSGSRLHSLLKEAIIQTGMEKNVFGNNPVSMSSPPEHLVTKDAVGGNGSAKPSSIDIVEIDAPNSANHIRSPPSGVPGATTRKSALQVERQNSEVSYYGDDEDANHKKYSRRGSIRHQFFRKLLPFWSPALPTLPVTAPPRKDGNPDDTVPGGHTRHHRPARMDPRKILLVIAIMACLATMGILYYRIAQRGFGEEQLPQGEEQ
ncbi:RING/U-box superfamily protein [Artemisia annua]|uniref:RING/U-box superfamily protein n=1 Tax=Artemisia annua TaxID=35608 RepID=A0A2U1LXB4_ARTAN|nr:RING/U-box superfamily protein [Artemisia annua]